MELRPDWPNRQVIDKAPNGAQISVHIEGLRDVDPSYRSRFFELGFQSAPLDSNEHGIWNDVMVNFETGTITINVSSTDHGAEIRRAIDQQLGTMASELEELEARRREQEQIAAQKARERQAQLDKLRSDLGN